MNKIKFKFIESKNIYIIVPLLQLLNKNISEEVLKERLDEMVKENYLCVGIFEEEKFVGMCRLWILAIKRLISKG